MDPARLRDFCRLIGYAARHRWAERQQAREPFRLYLPTSPASIALLLDEESRYGRERLSRIPDHAPGEQPR
jgi:hypothetical protein